MRGCSRGFGRGVGVLRAVEAGRELWVLFVHCGGMVESAVVVQYALGHEAGGDGDGRVGEKEETEGGAKRLLALIVAGRML